MRYTNVDSEHPPHRLPTVLRWALLDRVLGRRRIRPPGEGAASQAPDLRRIETAAPRGRLTWIGHSSFVVTLGQVHLLIDPVFSERLGLSYRRWVAPGLQPSQLPELGALLVTHAHYDHLDAPSIEGLSRGLPVVVPAGLGSWFRRRSFTRVHELHWWENVEVEGVDVTLVPARHWSRRTPWDLNRSLWGGYVLRSGEASVLHAGDSAYFPGFLEIGQRFPNLDAAMLPIGAYDPPWFMEWSHINPEQAGQAFLDLGARCLVPMHWGVFQLTDEPLVEPAERLHRWWHEHGPEQRQLAMLEIGESLELSHPDLDKRAASSGDRS